jgi:hypothetical protein
MDTKTAFLDSANRLARTRGFDAFSYADLSKDIGLRKVSIHYHFPTKADLALDLIAAPNFAMGGKSVFVSPSAPHVTVLMLP